MDVSISDWILLAMIVGVTILIFVQGQEIKHLQHIMLLQSKLNEAQNKQVEEFKKGRNWVDPGPTP